MSKYIRGAAAAGVLALLSQHASAQVAVGLKGGVNLNFLKVEYGSGGSGVTSEPDTKASGLGFLAGAYLNTTGGGNSGFLMEVVYSRRNSSESYNYTLTSTGSSSTSTYVGKIDYTFQYIQIPLLVCAKPTERLAVHFGAAAAFLQGVSSRDIGTHTFSSGSSGTFSSTYDKKTSTDKNLNKVIASVVIGADYEPILGLHGGLRFLYDLVDADKTSDITATGSELQFSVGYDLIGRRKE